MKPPKASPPPLPERPNDARIAIVSFPEDPDIKPYRDVVYFFYPTKH
jgi:hypothetical protein